MLGLDPPRVFGALTLVTVLFFLLGGTASARHRPLFRRLAIGAFAVAMAAALALAGLWVWGIAV
ncbi:MAG TPA: hypothetical protein VFW46_18240 [Stellaceae bacterium]|nr:hypothetical protein [Stellaceae bacterium]